MPRPNFKTEIEKIAEIIRVNHAGEYGAKRIYQGQIKFTKHLKDKILLNTMLEQEKVHLDYFENQLKVRKIRPTLLLPLWNLGGYLLGAISAKVGLKSAMLVTEAVEDVIENHYAEQLITLKDMQNVQDLVSNIRQFREDELEHKATAIEYESRKANFAGFCTKIIKSICRNAIFLSQKL
jgi:ubiquinone biosynthesis monooxygenase Coq7